MNIRNFALARRVLALHSSTHLNLIIAGLVAVVLAGCAEVPRQAFNRDAHKDIVTIGLIEPPVLPEYPVILLGHPGGGFGLIGGLIAAADIQNKTNEFTRAMREQNFNLHGDCRDAMTRELTQAGYRIKAVPLPRTELRLLETYDALDASVDAYLDVVCSGRYLAAGPATPYLPSVMLNVRMVKRSTKEIVYQDVLTYGYELRTHQAVNISADSSYRFRAFSDLMKDYMKAMDGMRAGVPMLANRLAQEVGRVSVNRLALPASPPAAKPAVAVRAAVPPPGSAPPDSAPAAATPATATEAIAATVNAAGDAAAATPQSAPAAENVSAPADAARQ